MTSQLDLRCKLKWPRRAAFAVLFILCTLITTLALSQDDENDPRRSWDRIILKSRTKPSKQNQPPGKPKLPVEKTAARPAAKPPEEVEGELIGITVWRLRTATPGDPETIPRELTQDGEYVLERASAGTPFREGDRVRLSIEYPRTGRYYLYVIDRDVYSDGTLGAPKLIYPGQTMPPDGNVLAPGKLLYLPADSDPRPYFRLRRSHPDLVSERLTLIISSEPLHLGVGPLKLDPALVAKWEKEWGGDTERREASSNTSRGWTPAEKEADEAGRELDQDGPLPQTIYRVMVKSDGKVALTVPLKIAP